MDQYSFFFNDLWPFANFWFNMIETGLLLAILYIVRGQKTERNP